MISLLYGLGSEHLDLVENNLVFDAASHLTSLQNKGVEDFLTKVNQVCDVDNVESTYYRGTERTDYSFYSKGKIVAVCSRWTEFNRKSLSFVAKCEGEIFK